MWCSGESDLSGMQILRAKRRGFFGETVSLKTPAKHIRLAETRHGLGTADPSRIELITLGWKDGILLESYLEGEGFQAGWTT